MSTHFWDKYATRGGTKRVFKFAGQVGNKPVLFRELAWSHAFENKTVIIL